MPKGSTTIAQAYAGHQFGHFTMLGDGRAIMLGEHLTNKNSRFDIQFKGSGRTSFSRSGDGRAVLGPMLREYIISEAIHALNIPTTRSLAVVKTGEKIVRENLLPGAILTRVASSHIRVGTFQYIAAKQNIDDLNTLVNYTIQRHYPEIRETKNHYLELLKRVASNQSILLSKWMSVGFVHGVMNTDNFTISGETIDYGPCAFLDEYHPGKVFSSIDQNGRYAFGNQPSIASWNLASLAGCLIAFINKDSDKANELATEVLDNFSTETNQRILDLMCKKIGIDGAVKENQDLLRQLLKIMMDNESDFTITFRSLADVLEDKSDNFDKQFKDKTAISEWLDNWKNILSRDERNFSKISEEMNLINPVFIPRNHQIQKTIESAYNNDFSKMQEMIEVVRKPFDENKKYTSYTEAPTEAQKVLKTFCGT